MFNIFKNSFQKKNTYDDITTLYNIIAINDDYVLINKYGKQKQLHIYKIEPVTIINITESVCNKIITIYKEFLRSINYDFQIYIQNKKVNINDYFNNIKLDSDNTVKNNLINIYKKQLEKSLKDNNIFTSSYYLIIAIEKNDNIDEISKNIYNLIKTGVFIEKLKGKINLNNFLYLNLNKVDDIC